MDSPIDIHFIGFLEHKLTDSVFARVDSETIDKLIEREDAMPSKLSKEQQDALKPLFEKVVGKGQVYSDLRIT
jgi:molecular chaperone HtpG